jgi:hypothetical protein
MIWEPYIIDKVAACTLRGLSSVWTQDSGFFHTTATLVFDMVVEVHCSDRVQR